RPALVIGLSATIIRRMVGLLSAASQALFRNGPLPTPSVYVTTSSLTVRGEFRLAWVTAPSVWSIHPFRSSPGAMPITPPTGTRCRLIGHRNIGIPIVHLLQINSEGAL